MDILNTVPVVQCGWGRMMGEGHMTGWGGGFMIIFWIVLLAVAVYFAVRFAGRTNDSSSKTASGETALDILKKRYASGEITKKDFEEQKQDIL